MKVLMIDNHTAWLTDIKNNLISLQQAVGGNIEAVTFRMGGFVMIVDEEGALVPKYLNLIASDIAGQPIHGKAVILCASGEEFTDISEDVIKSLGRYIRIRYNIEIGG